MPALREIFASFGIEFDRNRELQRGAQRVNDMTRRVRGLVVAASGAFAIRGFARFIRATIDMGDELDKTSQQVGLTVDQLERLRYVAQLSGVDATTMANALGQLQDRAYRATTVGGEVARAFQDLGVELRDENDQVRDAHDLFLDLADAIQGVDNSSRRTSLVMQTLGDAGRRLLPMLQGGSESIRQLEDEFTRLVGGSLQEFVTLSRDAQDDMTRFGIVMMSFRARLAVQFLPLLRQAIAVIMRWSGALRDLTAHSRLAESALIALGAVAAVVALATIGTWGPILLVVAAAALLALVIDDVWTAFEGGDSVIAYFYDYMAKAFGSTLRFVDVLETLRIAWKWLTEAGSITATIDQLLTLARAGFQVENILDALTSQWVLLHRLEVPPWRTFLDAVIERFGFLSRIIDAIIGQIRTLQGMALDVGATFRGAATGEMGPTASGFGRAAGALGEAHYRRARSGGRNVLQAITGGATSGKGPIDARQAVTVQITGGAYGSPEELARAVSSGVRSELDRHARRLRAALVPGSGT